MCDLILLEINNWGERGDTGGGFVYIVMGCII